MAENEKEPSARQRRLIQMLKSDDKWMSTAKNFITLLVRKCMYDMNMQPHMYFAFIERWLIGRYGVHKDTVPKISTARNNFVTEVTQDNMTVNTFQKFTQSIGAHKVTVQMTMEFNDGRPPVSSAVSFTNYLGREEDEPEQPTEMK